MYIRTHSHEVEYFILQEEDELIEEWQPEPLVPDEFPKDREVDFSPIVTGYVNYRHGNSSRLV